MTNAYLHTKVMVLFPFHRTDINPSSRYNFQVAVVLKTLC